MNDYDRPNLEEHLDTTIPSIGHIHTEYFFERVTAVTLAQLELGAGNLVLDVASGMGMDACLLAEGGFTVLAMEPMKRMAGYSRYHHDSRGVRSSHLLGYAEEIPLRSASVDQALCKGSLDHFLDPRAALKEIRRVLRPGGRVIVAVANYGSLSCRFSRAVTRLHRLHSPPDPDYRPPHEPPPDHHTVFNADIARRMVGEFFVIRKELGVGILWGAPYLNGLFDRLPPPLARAALEKLYVIGELLPHYADMTVLVGEKP